MPETVYSHSDMGLLANWLVGRISKNGGSNSFIRLIEYYILDRLPLASAILGSFVELPTRERGQYAVLDRFRLVALLTIGQTESMAQ